AAASEPVPGEEPAAAEQPAATQEPPAPAERPSAAEGGAGTRPDLPPGAELDPIAIEPERQLDPEERARLEAEAEERARLEAEATAGGTVEEPVAPREPKVELAAERTIQATGKRKSSIARVIVRAGGGAFVVNDRELAEYFPRQLHQTVARQALTASGYEGNVDVRVRVHG